MNPQNVLKHSFYLGAAALTGSMLLSSCSQEKEVEKPNFVFFLVDDLGWTDLGCFGSSFYETPNVDRLAATGVKFTQAYASCPVSSPTRSSIMTGKYPVKTGITDYINPSGWNQPEKWSRKTRLLPAPYQDRLSLDEVTIAEKMKQNDYATFFAGKWHLGVEGWFPENQGFDVNKGGLERGGPYGGNKYFSPYDNPRLSDGPEGEHLPDRLASEAVKFIESRKDSSFFVYLAFYSVHTPLMAREDLKEKYEQKKISLGLEDQWGEEGERKKRLVQCHTTYAGMVDAMDQAVGKVLDKLEDLELDENTIIIFMSDNGGLSTSEGHPTSNLPLRAGKGWMYEGGIREPMIVRWPGVSMAGSTCNQYITSTDFYPTILEMADIELAPQQHQDGVSMVPLFKGETIDRGPVFWHYPHYGNQGGGPSSAIRDGDWKLIKWYDPVKVELFNLRDDIGETNELSVQHPDKKNELLKKLNKWLEVNDAKLPTENRNFK